MLESKIEREICQRATKYGILIYKFTSPSNRGVPDRIFIKNGNLVFVEFKSPKGKLTKLQEHNIKKITDQGFQVLIVNDIEKGLISILQGLE